MAKSEVAKPAEYRDLIREVYIDPIRTVVVIDDEFPSLDGLIARELKEEGAWDGKPDDANKVKEILQFCRKKEKAWLVDVHDGKYIPYRNDEIIAPHLIHSDLMILDFHLGDDDGRKAIKILKKLAESNHFNMVIVYTNGDPQAGGDIESVVRDITLGLIHPDESLHFSVENEAEVRSQLEMWEVEDEEIIQKLNSEITSQTYLNYRSHSENNCKTFLEKTENENLRELFNNTPKTVQIEHPDLLKWLLLAKEQELFNLKKLSESNLGHVSTAPSSSTGINWIRTDRLFVTVVTKQHPPQELPEKLLNALHEWCPEPHRLLMSQMRFLMDDRGVIAESKVLGNNHIQVGWLQELLDSDSQTQNQVITDTIFRHWEALGDELKQDIKIFADRLVSHLTTSSNKNEVIKKHSKINVQTESDNIAKHINCYNCSKPAEGFHLTTGHILELDVGSLEKEYWICLSPACDLVPGRNEKGLIGRVKDSMPFIAVKLEKATIKSAVKNVNHNIFLFLEIDNEICAFSFHPDGDVKRNPVWEQLIAEKQGKFEPKAKKLQIWRPGGFSKNRRVTMQKFSARVAAQLRYEYALNLLQRFGGIMTRVGLDFSK